MRVNGHSIALTVDEFGGIAGIATLKQLVGIIVGEVTEEEGEPEDVLPLSESNYLIDAGKTIVETNEELGIDLPEGEYQTVAGLVLKALGKIPNVEEIVDIDNVRLTVKSMVGVRLDKVQVRILPRVE